MHMKQVQLLCSKEKRKNYIFVSGVCEIIFHLISAINTLGTSMVASHHVGKNFSVSGYSNWDNVCCDIGRYFVQTEQAAPVKLTSEIGQNLDGLGCINYDSGSSSGNICWNVAEDIIQLEQAAPSELTLQVVPNLSDLGYINFDSDTSSCNVSWTRMTTVNFSCNAMLKYCEPDVDVAIENHQMEVILSHERATMPVDSTEQSEDASQSDKCQVQLIGKSSEIPQKNAAKGRRNESTSYPCAECGKQFSKKSRLTDHFRIHTGEKPYKCAQCDYVCAQAGALASHKRVHSECHRREAIQMYDL